MGDQRRLRLMLASAAALLLATACAPGMLGPVPTADATARRVQSGAPAPAPSSASAPEPIQFPDASTTGVPPGVVLRPSEGMVISQPGTVLEGLDVTGAIDIEADDVVIRNSKVTTRDDHYPIRIHPGVRGALIENVEVSNDGHHGKGIYFNRSSGTVRRANIHSAEDGVFITGDDVTVEDSYIHHLTATETSHNDTIQIRRGNNIVIRGNNLQVYNDQTGDPMNAAVQIGSLVGDQPVTNLLVEGNLMNGGSVTINGGRAGDIQSGLITGNRFGRDFLSDVSGNLPAGVKWASDNVFDDNGEPA